MALPNRCQSATWSRGTDSGRRSLCAGADPGGVRWIRTEVVGGRDVCSPLKSSSFP